MTELGRFTRELRTRLWKPAVDEEVDSELAHHLEMLERDFVARGMDPAAAHAAARARFGDVAGIGDACRDIGETRDRERRRARWLEELGQDVRYAVRQLRAAPRFAVVATLTLAIGLGASTTIFGIADAVLLRPLPFREPAQLVVAEELTPAGDAFALSEPDFLDWRARARRFTALAAFAERTPNLSGDAGPEQVRGAVATHELFGVLGIAPALGRTYTAEEDARGGDYRVAVISDALWRRRFGADRGVLARTVDLDGVRHRVIGVMPPGFDFPNRTDVWTPLVPVPQWPRGDRRIDAVVARLAPGATVEQARDELHRIAAQLGTEYPVSNDQWGARVRPFGEWYVSPDLRARVVTLLATVGLLLAMACVNVASLLLARAGARERAMAVRAALGAGRGRIVRQLLTESVLLSLVGAAAGVTLAAAAVPIIRRTGSAAVPRLAELALDWRVLAFALAACMATGIVFGLAPALRLSRAASTRRRVADRGGALAALLRSGTRVADTGRVRSALIVASVSLATLMLVGAGLVGGSFARLMRVDLGFAADRVITGSLVLPERTYDEDRTVAFYAELTRRLGTIPGVRAAGLTNIAPLAGGNTSQQWTPGATPASRDAYRGASWRAVTPGFFTALGIPLRRGRLLDETDRYPAPRAIAISERMARLGWPGVDPIGRQVTLGNGNTYTIVGVVGDTRAVAVDSAPAPTMYFPAARFPWPAMWVTVRSDRPTAAMAAAIQREIRALDPTLALAQVQPLGQLVHDATAQPRLTALVVGLFAGAALALAAVGLYGLVSYTVVQRTREIGVRMALGAAPPRIVRAVLGHGLRLAALGVALGSGAAAAGARLLRTILFQTEPTDAATFAAVAVVLLVVAGAASIAPARRAARLDPGSTLRAD